METLPVKLSCPPWYYVGSGLDASSIVVHAGGNYLFELSSWFFGPTFALDFLSLSTDGLTENSGSPLDVKIDDRNEIHYTSRLGGTVTKFFEVKKAEFVSRVEIAWVHDFNENDNSLIASFTEFEDAAFEVQGTAYPADVINVEIGLAVYLDESFAAFAELATDLGEDYSSFFASFGFEWQF